MSRLLLRRRALLASGGVVFDPLSIGWHAAFWAEDPNWTNPGDGNPVGQWDDASGNGRHATQATASKQPTFRAATAAFNGRPTVQAERASSTVGDFLRTAAWTALPQPNTIVIVGSTVAPAPAEHFFVDGLVSGNRHAIYTRNDWSIHRWNAGVEANIDGAVDTDPHLYIVKFDGASSTFDADGAVFTGNPGTHSLTGLTLFADYRGFLYLDGHLAFVGAKAGELTEQEETDLKAGFSDLYALTIA